MGWLSHGFTRKLGAKIGDLHAKDSHSFCKRQIRPGPSVAGPLLLNIIWGTPRLFCLHSALREISQLQRHILLHYSSYSRPPDPLISDHFDPTGLYTMEYEACPVFKSHLELLTNFLFVNYSFVPLVQLMTNALLCR